MPKFWNVRVVFERMTDEELSAQLRLSKAIADLAGRPLRAKLRYNDFNDSWRLIIETHEVIVKHSK